MQRHHKSAIKAVSREVRAGTNRRAKLVARCEISGPRKDLYRRQGLRGEQTNLKLSASSVARSITWAIPEYILIPQLHTYLRCDIRQIGQVANRESTPAGQLGHFGKKFRSFFLLDRFIFALIENANGIQLNVRFFQILANVGFAVPTMIIASVGDDEQSLFRVLCAFHLA